MKIGKESYFAIAKLFALDAELEEMDYLLLRKHGYHRLALVSLEKANAFRDLQRYYESLS